MKKLLKKLYPAVPYSVVLSSVLIVILFSRPDRTYPSGPIVTLISTIIMCLSAYAGVLILFNAEIQKGLEYHD